MTTGLLSRALVDSDGATALAFWTTIPGMGLSASDQPAELARFWSRNPGLSFGAFDSAGELVATALSGHDGRRGFVYHVAVAPPYRDHGLARALVERCLVGLKAESIRKVHLMVLADNALGLAYWTHRESRGWTRRGDLVLFSLEVK